jgi:tetratricopeptide (TPR) repeat protein
MVYFSMLMAKKDYDSAEEVLKNAGEYAELTDDDKITIKLQRSSLYIIRSENDPENKDNYFEQAIKPLEDEIEGSSLTPEQKINVMLTIAEAYLKVEEYNKSIRCLQHILCEAPTPTKDKTQVLDTSEETVQELSPEELDAMLEADMALIQEKIDTGELESDLGMYAETEYDENGNLVPVYDESFFAFLNNNESVNKDADNDKNNGGKAFDLPVGMREKVYFTLLSCYLAMDDFAVAEKYAKILRYSENKYYNYYGIYTCAYITKKINDNKEIGEKQYAEAIAYFRNKSFADHKDSLAVLFRGRLYAEQGKYEKAEELAELLAENDRNSLLEYIKKNRS